MGQQMGETESVTAGPSPNVPGVSPIKANKDRPQSIQPSPIDTNKNPVCEVTQTGFVLFGEVETVVEESGGVAETGLSVS
jgi:hypothetical protein